MPDLLSQATDLPSFRVVPPAKQLNPAEILAKSTLSDGTPMIGPDGLLVPAGRSFSMIVNSATKIFSYRFDEAMRDNFVNARAMRRDAFLRGLLEERILPTINRRWHLEVDDDRDPDQTFVRDGLTRIIENIRDFDMFKRALLDGVWFGRAGCQWAYKRDHDNDGLWGLSKWDPIHGDSIQPAFDGTPAILLDSVTTAWYAQNGASFGPGGDLRPTDRGGTALVLQRPYWRDRFAIHMHMREKADYFEGELAGSVQGLGLRGLVYWQYVVRTDALTWMLAYMQAVGQMDLLCFNYPAGDAAAKLQQEQNANKIIGKAAIVVPRNPIGNWPAVEQIQMNAAGLKAMHELVADYFDRHIERLIVGQSMSAGADKGTGLGGTGRAEFTKATKDEILVYDTNRIDETITYDLLKPLARYNFKWAKFPIRFKSILPDLDAAEKVANGSMLISAGVSIKVDEFREAAGYSRPEDGDEVVGAPAPPMGPAGMPGGPPPDGGMPAFGGGGSPPPDAGGGPPPGAGGPPPMGPAGMPFRSNSLPTLNMGPGGSNTHIPSFGGKKKGPPEYEINKTNAVGFTRYMDNPPSLYATEYQRDSLPLEYSDGPHKYCSTQVNLSGIAAIKVLEYANFVRTEHLAKDGRETTPHVTLRYGLHDPDPDPAARLIAGTGPVRLKLGKVSVFKGSTNGKDYDVLKVDVDSKDMLWLNKKLGKLKGTDTFKYHPHATIAYVKAGMGEWYAKQMAPLNLEFLADAVVFSDTDAHKTILPLVEPPTTYAALRPSPYVTDDGGREHKDAGPGGGQFTSKGGSGSGTSQSETPTPTTPPGPARPKLPNTPKPPDAAMAGVPGRKSGIHYKTPQDFAASLAFAVSSHRGIDPFEAEDRKKAAASVAAALPPTAVARLARGGLAAVVSHGDSAGVGAAWYKDAESKDPMIPKGKKVAAFYDNVDRTIEINGGDTAGTLAHEIGHALDNDEDGLYWEFSDSPEFRMCWAREIKGGNLSNYATTDEQEGFAEYCRLLYGLGPAGRKEAESEFPLTFAYFKKIGLA